MEPKCELGAMTSSHVLGTSSESIIIDRFSDLPDEIAHHILSFHCGILMNLIRVGAVSKRCRQLYLSLPSLIIVSGHVSNCTRSRVRLMNYWDRYLFHRGDNKIECFGVCWSFDAAVNAEISDEFFRITTWIQNAVRCNVKVLHLEFTQNNLNIVVLPSCIFHCHSLTELYVNLSGGDIQSPSLSFSSNLQHLELKDAMVEDDRFFEWISSSCKCIKELRLENVSGIKDITIESSSLEIFIYLFPFNNYELWDLNISGEKLEEIIILWHFDSNDDSRRGLIPRIRSLNILAPKLKKITWGGNFLDHQHLGNLMCLEEAKIFLFPDLDDFNNPFEVLCSIRVVKALVLNEETTKAFFMESSMPLRLDNIHDLTLHVRSVNDDFVPAMVSLFRGITTLNTLCITSVTYKQAIEEAYNETEEEDNNYEEEDNGTEQENSETTEEDGATEEGDNPPKFDVEYWKSQNLNFTCELKEVKLEIVEGNNNELDLARYILEHAQKLKKMVILHSPQHPDILEMVRKSKMISTATVVLQEVIL
ncbi:uncharacterized protein LOC133706604 [Rosa rugosa]|uniref:uncharacterized protein LOC133706604 n=1 Tax=Rosa rugosa TaxID=74645 RepID=UPI002B401D3E|nr:uncharacterized protein LOC133706604 [Rosa rugosa]